MRRYVLITALFLGMSPAAAHEERGPNGGRVADLGPFHAELVVKGKIVEVYLSDPDDKTISVSGYKGLAILATGGKSERVQLEATDGNKLAGTASMTVPRNAKGVIRLTAPDGKTNQAKFD